MRQIASEGPGHTIIRPYNHSFTSVVMLAKLLDYLEHFRCEECVDDNSLPGVYFRGVKDLFRQSGPTTLQRYSTLK